MPQSPGLQVRPLDIAPAGITRSLEEGYANGSPYQWALELWRNFWQAVGRSGHSTSHVPSQRFDMLRVHGGALKRVVWNTGPHMPESELREYMLTLGQGGGDMWSLDNPLGDRHAGARESLLPWNHAGVVVLSYHPVEQPDGAMVWLRRGEDGTYGAALLPTDIETALGDVEFGQVVPLGVDPFGFDWRDIVRQTANSGRGGDGGLERNGGVAFVLLGSDEYADDLDGVDNSQYARSRGRAETPTGLATFLLDKIADTEGTNVSVVFKVGAEPDRLTRTDSTGTEQAFDSRTIHGLPGWTTRAGSGTRDRVELPCESGSIPLYIDDEQVGEAKWTLLPDGAPRNNLMPFRGEGHVVARYRDELMFRPNAGSPARQLAPWGVIVPEVAKRTRIIVELNQRGEGWHVIQNPARSDLRAADGAAIPWESFHEQFNDAMEELAAPIWTEMARIRAAQPRNLEAERRLLAKLRRRIDRNDREPEDMAVTNPGGDGSAGSGQPAEAGTGHEHNDGPSNWPPPSTEAGPLPGDAPATTPVTEAEGSGEHAVARRRRRPGLPTPEWVSGEVWSEEYEYDPRRLVVVERSGNDVVIRYNLDHDIYVSQVAWFTEECARSRSPRIRRLPAPEIVAAVKEAYHLDSAPRYLWGMRMDPNFREVLDRPRSDPNAPCVMTIGAGGFNNVDQVIQADLEARAHGQRSAESVA
jgi:hypothetical protein